MQFFLQPESFSLVFLDLDKRLVSFLLQSLVKSAGLKGGEVEVLVCGDGRIAELNGHFLGRPGPTNVLSFPDGQGGGQLAISWETTLREAHLYGCGKVEHFLRLVAHGLLHLSGHEHSEQMFELTEQAVDQALGMAEKNWILA